MTFLCPMQLPSGPIKRSRPARVRTRFKRVSVFGANATRNFFARFLLLLLVAVSLEAAALESTNPSLPLFGIGISINDPPSAVPLAKLLGANVVRVDAPWSQIEKSRGHYIIPEWLERTVNSMVQSGVEPLLILAYGNRLYDGGDKPTSSSAIQAFAQYGAFVVNHFRGKVRYYDLWNEWDAHTGKTTPLGADEYVNLARFVYPILKGVDPTVQILSGGISDKGIREGFFERFFALDGQRYVDGLSIHPYVWNSRDRRTPEGAMEVVDRVARISKAENGGQSLPIYVTELGWPTHTGKYAASEDEVAWFLTRFTLLAASRDYVKGVLWYCLLDQGSNPENKEHRFGVLDRNQRAKSAAIVFKKLSGTLKGAPIVKVHRDGLNSVAEIFFSGKAAGQYVWQEVPVTKAAAAKVGQALTTTGAEQDGAIDPRAPLWQAAAPVGNPR